MSGPSGRGAATATLRRGREARRAVTVAAGGVALAVVATAFVPAATAATPTGAGTASGTRAAASRAGIPWVTNAGRWPRRSTPVRSTGARGAVNPTTRAAVPATLDGYLLGDRTDLQWSLQATHTGAAWQASRGDGIVVATVDSGADATAPDLVGRLVPGAHLDPTTDRIVAGSRPDTLGHGTHVAAIIAGTDDGHGVTGVAPGAKVLPVDLDTGALLTGADVAAGIAWAVAHGARVVNLSLGYADVATSATDVKAICAAVGAAVARNVVVVAAAGNDGTGWNAAEAPARCPGAISVAALDSSLRATSWSSFDGTVTLAAPGDAIWSAVPSSTSPLRYVAESGTSMASPFVAGVAALLLAQHPDWTPARVRARLVQTAQDVAPAGPDPRTGAGVVDPAAALGVGAPAPEPVPTVALAVDSYASRTDSSGRDVYDQVLVHWVPDPTVPATGYRITRWTSSGVSTTTVDGSTVRALFPTGPAGYQVTALTADGDVPSAPVWFPLPGQDPTPVYPVTNLKARWTSRGELALTWTNPARNAGVADEWAVSVNGEMVTSSDKVRSIPGRYTIPAGKVPVGDLVVSVWIGSSSSLDVEETRVSVGARVPFSGTAVSAGTGRYRIDLLLAASRRASCGRSRCTGALVTVWSGGWSATTRIDARGHAVVVLPGTARKGKLTVGAWVSGRPALSDAGVPVAVR